MTPEQQLSQNPGTAQPLSLSEQVENLKKSLAGESSLMPDADATVSDMDLKNSPAPPSEAINMEQLKAKLPEPSADVPPVSNPAGRAENTRELPGGITERVGENV